jgi:hypothetical protein
MMLRVAFLQRSHRLHGEPLLLLLDDRLLAYATAADLREAMLIYADGPPQPRSHHIRDRCIDLHIHHLNFDQPPTHVPRDLAHLAAQVRPQPSQGRDEPPSLS